MDTIKTWLVEVALKKMAPSAVRAIVAAGIGFVLAHMGALASIGLVYDKVSNTLSLHLTTLTEWAVALGLGTATAFLQAGQHHIEEAVAPVADEPK